jgi:hypothetical protein
VNQESFTFTAHFSRRVEAGFHGGRVSSDGGALLLREAERKINLLGRLAACFTGKRAGANPCNPERHAGRSGRYLRRVAGFHRETLNKSLLLSNIPSGAKARVDFAAFAARLKACPFKTST